MKHYFTVFLLVTCFSAYSQSIVYVTAFGAGDYSGSSWANATYGEQLQPRLASAGPGTQFWVARGTYRPTTGTDRSISFFIPSGVQVYGGFAGTETSPDGRSQNPPLTTIFSGEIGNGNSVNDNSYHVVTFRNAAASTRLDGVVITGGNADGSTLEDGMGGGVYNNGSGAANRSEPTVVNCQLTVNYAKLGGGGLFSNAANQGNTQPIIEQCLFEGNRADAPGGGVYGRTNGGTCRPSFRSCRFINNRASLGGGVYFVATIAGGQSNPLFTDCTFERNLAFLDGGGAAFVSGFAAYVNPVFINCLFNTNTAIERGGAVKTAGTINCDVNPTFSNCTLVGNAANRAGSALYGNVTSDSYSTYRLTNCILWANVITTAIAYDNGENTKPPTYTINYSNIQGGFSGTGNIDQDPLFADAPNGNYRLRAGSPSINTGDPASTTTTVTERDLDGNPRMAENRIDMGAYEFQVTAQTGTDLSLSLRADNRTPGVNQPVLYILTVTNNGPITATNVVWQNRLPDNLAFVNGANVSSSNNVLSGQVNALSPGASATFTYQLQPTQAGLYVNAAQLTASDQTDPDSQPNSGTGDGQDDAAQADVRAGATNGPVFASANPNQVPLPPVQSNQPTPDPDKADLSLRLSVSSRTPKPGDLITYSLLVTNQGGATATGVNVTAYLPANQQFVTGNNMAPGNGDIAGTVSSIAAGSSVELQFTARVTTPGMGATKAQIRQASPVDADSTPDNGTENGEDDTASVAVRTTPN